MAVPTLFLFAGLLQDRVAPEDDSCAHHEMHMRVDGAFLLREHRGMHLEAKLEEPAFIVHAKLLFVSNVATQGMGADLVLAIKQRLG